MIFRGLRNLTLCKMKKKWVALFTFVLLTPHWALVECKFLGTCSILCLCATAAVSLHYIEHNSNFCYEHGWYWCCHWLDTTSSSSRTIFVCCVYQMHTYIFNKTNSTIYQLKRDERIEIECIGVAHKSMHMKGYDICMDTWSLCCSRIYAKYKKFETFSSHH